MISSTIGELLVERREINTALEAENLADGWLFEIHATASGASAEERYLDIARRCDVYVIVIAEQASEATEAEYHAAFADNPRKILPFFVGTLTDATKPIRDLIESRHVRVRFPSRAGLAGAVVDAIADFVRSGEVVRESFVKDVDERLRRAERVVAPDLPLAFVPWVRPSAAPADDDKLQPATSLFLTHRRAVLEGIGGSGKTFAGLAALKRADSGGVLPIVVPASVDDTSIHRLLVSRFETAGFFPGDALLQQLARDGRLMIMIDGIDALPSSARRELLGSVTEFSHRFTRSSFLCCVRRAHPDELPGFERLAVEPMSASQTSDMFVAAGASQVQSFPSQIADLARWPLWATALLTVGPTVSTGLVLLRQLLERRVRNSGAYSGVEEELLMRSAAALAFKAWPQPRLTTPDALAAVTSWGASGAVSSVFDVPPAESVLQRLSAAGIVQQTPDIEFAHPLFATYLGAAHAAESGEMTDAMKRDPEFAMFVAALLDDSSRQEKLQHLARHGPIGQARYLRLVEETAREPDVNDALEFCRAVGELSGTPAACIVTDGWTAWRNADEAAVADEGDVEAWLASGDVNFIPGNAFSRRSPVDLAAIEALARFKHAVVLRRPDGDRFDRVSDRELRRLRRIPRAELDELIVQSVFDWRAEWRQLASELGLDSLPEAALPDGDPVIRVCEDWPDPSLKLEWGDTAGVLWDATPEQPPWGYRPLSTFLEPGRSARIYSDLTDRAELALGCTFGSQAWTRPELVAAWAW